MNFFDVNLRVSALFDYRILTAAVFQRVVSPCEDDGEVSIGMKVYSAVAVQADVSVTE